MCLPILVAAHGLEIPSLAPVMPQGIFWLWLFGVGLWASISHMMMSFALKFAPSATLAPLHYLEIVTALILGYVIFSDFPNTLALVGTAIIVASGLYVFHREQVLERQNA